jgi:mono/diheme cytochrome c family protein
MMRPTVLVYIGIAASALIGWSARAAEPEPEKAAYLKYCSACHGAEGKGDGVVAAALRPKPTDLTQLAKQHGGTFPFMAVRDAIDGRKPVPAHGSSDMPVWGEVFTEEKAAAQPEGPPRGRVQLITEFVKSIQAP